MWVSLEPTWLRLTCPALPEGMRYQHNITNFIMSYTSPTLFIIYPFSCRYKIIFIYPIMAWSPSNLVVNRFAVDNGHPMAIVEAMPGHSITPFPATIIYRFDRISNERPNAIRMGGHPVYQFLLRGVTMPRLEAISTHLAHAYLTHTLTSSYPVGEGPLLTEYQVMSDGHDFIILVENMSREILIKIVRILYRPWSSDLGLPYPFTLSPSIHNRIISYGQWSRGV